MAEVRLPRLIVQLLGKKFTGGLRLRWDGGETVLYMRDGLPLHTPELFEPFGKVIRDARLVEADPPDAKPVNPFSLLCRGIARYPTELLMKEAGELVGPYLKLRDGAEPYVQRFPLTEGLEEIPHYLEKEPFNLTELTEILSMESTEVLRVLYAFAAATLLQGASPPHDPKVLELRVELLKRRHASESQDPFEILGVAKDAGKEEIEASFRELARRFHPDAVAAKGLDVWREEAEELFRKISEAYSILSNDEERKKLLEAVDAQDISGMIDSELYFQKGKILLKQKKYAEAANEFKTALDQVPEEAAYLAYYAWARYLAAEDKNSIRTETLGLLHKATKIAPRLAMAHYFLGKVMVDAGVLDDAIKEMERAYRLDPNLIEAAREARLLKRRKAHHTSLTGKFLSFLRKE